MAYRAHLDVPLSGPIWRHEAPEALQEAVDRIDHPLERLQILLQKRQKGHQEDKERDTRGHAHPPADLGLDRLARPIPRRDMVKRQDVEHISNLTGSEMEISPDSVICRNLKEVVEIKTQSPRENETNKQEASKKIMIFHWE